MSTVLANKLKTKSNDTTRKQLRKCTLNDLALVEDSLDNIVENDELEMVLSDYVKIKELGNLIYGDTPIVQQGLTEKDLSTLTVPIKTTATLTVDGDSNFGKIIANNITTDRLTSTALTATSLTAYNLSTSSAQNIQVGTSSLQQYLDAIDVGLTEKDLSTLTVPIKTTSKLDVTGKTTLQDVAISGGADVDRMSAITLTASTQYNTNLTTDNLSAQKLSAGMLSTASLSTTALTAITIGSKTLDEYLTATADIEYMLDKRHGGVVTGDIGILCGNYVQITDDKNVYNYSEKNAFIQAEEAFNGSGKTYGPAHTGSYGYCILSVVINASGHGFKLSGPLDKLTSLTANNVDGAGIKYNPKNGCSKALSIVLGNSTDISNAMFSLALSNQGEPLAYQISSIDEAAGIAYVKQPFSSGTSALTALTEAQCKNLFDSDDNALYVPGYPEIGNVIMKTFYAQHVEGGSSRAVGKYTHAEGRDNLADVRYAHVEGAHNIAAGMASHAEGFTNKVLGRYSHVEGYLNTTKGDYSHAAGICAVANANYQYAWNGIQTHAYYAENDGTFNINPKNGMAGIYVGHHSLAEMSLPVSSLSTTVVYNNGTVSTLAIENNLLSSSIPNKKNAIDITIGNAVHNIGIQAFKQCSSLTNIVIPNSVSTVQNQAFYQCLSLTGISFPDSVLTIDYSAMSQCHNLRTIKLPNKLQRLADYTVISCTNLIDIHIPNSVSAIGSRCFENCSKLVHVNIPSSTLSIGQGAFNNCSNLNSVEFEYKTMEQIANIANYHTSTLDLWGIADASIIKSYDQTYKTGYFNTNPNNGLSGFYINGKNFMQCVLSALNDTHFKAQFKTALNAIINS